MKIILSGLLLLFQFNNLTSFIIPDEVPSLLSVIYSNIPVLKKGTDSRLGWGFRLGNRADFQVLVELGPQTYTQPLANQGDNANSKRNALNSLSNTLYAQRQREKNEISDSEGGKWLADWSATMINNRKPENIEINGAAAKPGLAVGEIDAKSVIPEESAKKLVSKTVSTTTSQPVHSEKALDDVDLE